MAHSFVQAHDDCKRRRSRTSADLPSETRCLLIDTYDTVEGAPAWRKFAPGSRNGGIRIKGVRSTARSDTLSRAVRRVLNEGLACTNAVIFRQRQPSTKQRVHAWLRRGADHELRRRQRSLTTSRMRPYLDAVKLQEYATDRRGASVLGQGDLARPQAVYRRLDSNGRCAGDTVALTPKPSLASRCSSK